MEEAASKPQIEQVTPFYHVTDLEAAVAFFVKNLGFKAWVHDRDYAYVQREGAGFRLLLRGDAAEWKGSERTAERRYAYLDVADVDALYAEFRSKLTDELSNNPHGPRDQPYGQREFTVFGPEGIVLFVGQALGALRHDS